jgi:Zn-dependent protease
MNEANIIYLVTIWALPVLLAITLHEVAHGWVAKQLGDLTASQEGRLSMNPLRHIDPLTTVVLPLVLLIINLPPFGAAKPVPVEPGNFRKPREHMAIVALAGPLSNLIMAMGWALLLSLAVHGLASTWIGYPLSLMAQAGITINLILMVLNLLPLPPLDGGRIVVGMLKPSLAVKYARIEPYGFLILLVLIFSTVLGRLIWPVIGFLESLLHSLFGV